MPLAISSSAESRAICSSCSSSNAVLSGAWAALEESVPTVSVVGILVSQLAESSMPEAQQAGTRGIHGAASAGPLETNDKRPGILPALTGNRDSAHDGHKS